MSSRKPVAIDLFSGCGGLTEGLKQAGFKVLSAIELEPIAASTYKLNHPRVNLLHADIRDVDAEQLRTELRLRRGALDLLAACPPCQGFSALTSKNGARRVNDKRNSLINDCMRFVEALQPRAIMLENVPGLVGKAGFIRFVRSLRDTGYHADFRVLDAAKYGVPQRRRRLILVAFRKESPVFAIPEDCRVTVRDAIGDLPHPSKSRDVLHHDRAAYSEKLKSLIRAIPLDGGSRSALGATHRLACHQETDGFRDVYGRMRWDDVSPTITSGCINPSKGRFLHPRQHRPITLREAALIQTFPGDYEFDLSRGKYAVAAMIGNALPPEFIRRHAKAIRKTLNR